MESKPILTIAIPTYNRPSLLIQNLSRIIPQLKKNVELLIIDNHSDEQVSKFLDHISPDIQIKLIRNIANIGGNANILRCIEEACGSYLWILGDDDFPKPNALDHIFDELRNFPIWVSFCSHDKFNPIRISDKKLDTLVEFLTSLTCLNEIVFLSNNIFKLDVMREGLTLAYDNNHMMLPHVIAMLEGCVKKNAEGHKQYSLSSVDIFESTSNNKDKQTKWSLYKVYIGVIYLPYLFKSKILQKKLTNLISNDRKRWLSNPYLIGGMWELSHNEGISKSFFMTSSFIFGIAKIDGIKWPFTICLYAFSLLTGKLAWSHKDKIKRFWGSFFS
jgi:glycosyltransferase involved in cell wall biosynthesis